MTKDMTIPLDIHRTTGTDTGSIPNMKRKSTIMHRPEGWHPYAESGIGRTPLHPLPGEVVHLSVLPADPLAGGVPGGVPGDMVACAPVGTEPIRMTWSVNGVSQPEKVLQPRVSGDGRQAAGCGIGPFSAGDHVTYRFTGAGGVSPEYAFSIAEESRSVFSIGKPSDTGVRMNEEHPESPVTRLTFGTGIAALPALHAVSVEGRLHIGADPALLPQGESFVFLPDNTGDGGGLYGTASGLCIRFAVESNRLDLLRRGEDGTETLLAGNLQLIVQSVDGMPVSVSLRYGSRAQSVFGLGERFDGVDRIGTTADTCVFDQFTRQTERTYYPLPFHHDSEGLGLTVRTDARCRYDFGARETGVFSVTADCGGGTPTPEWIFTVGSPDEQVRQQHALFGAAPMPPVWAFGPWISSNRWNRQDMFLSEVEKLEANGFPATVAVLEAWSDEATFYAFNGSEYELNDGARGHAAAEYRYPADGPWPDPAGMIQTLADKGIRLVLWQIPVLKRLDPGQVCPQHDRDAAYASAHGYVARNPDGTPYRIPEYWFGGSLVPDFSNPEASAWWFDKRRHLLEMGVAGFKTDGGEFVYGHDIVFHGEKTGPGMRNRYPEEYLAAYADFAGPERVLFSRDGYLGSHRHPIHWAGDQLSTWAEFRSVLKAGLSAGLSGIPYWGFDIAGFAGPLPDAELYIRATQAAAFAPVMQWHSEPTTGQFAEILPGTGGNNDRSPWNIAAASGSTDVVPVTRAYTLLRMRLLPELAHQAEWSARTGVPMLRHPAFDAPGDVQARAVEDQFLLGDLMVAPVIEAGATAREVYLPAGGWIDLWTGSRVQGPCRLRAEAPLERIPLYLKEGGCIRMDMDVVNPFARAETARPTAQGVVPVADAETWRVGLF